MQLMQQYVQKSRITSWPRRSRSVGGRSTFSQAVAPASSGAWMRSRMRALVNRPEDALASKTDRKGCPARRG